MGVFNFLKPKNNNVDEFESSTNFYIVSSVSIKSLDSLPGSGSINEIMKTLGYEEGQFFDSFPTFSEKIDYFTYKPNTKEILLVKAKKNIGSLTKQDILELVENTNWEIEWSLNS